MKLLSINIPQIRPSCATLVLLLACVGSATGQMSFWLSTTGDVSVGSAAGETPMVQVADGNTGEIYIWAKPDTDKTLESFSLNLVSTSETAIEFTSAEVINGGRFSFVFDTSHGLDIEDQTICVFPAPLHGVWGLSGLSIDPVSGTGLNAAAPGGDPHYDAVNGTWLLATIGYSAAAIGSTDLFLEIGQIGMNYEGEAAETMTVRMGNLADPPLSNEFNDRCEPSVTRDAQIEVVDMLPGDFNLNGSLDADDIDLLSAEVLAATNNAFFDLTGAATVDQSDRVYWVETLVGTNFGDADLNGLVDFADFLRLSAAFGNAAGWRTEIPTGICWSTSPISWPCPATLAKACCWVPTTPCQNRSDIRRWRCAGFTWCSGDASGADNSL